MSVLPRFNPFHRLRGRDLNLILDTIENTLGPITPDPVTLTTPTWNVHGVTSLTGRGGIYVDPSVGDVLVSAAPALPSEVPQGAYTASAYQSAPQSIDFFNINQFLLHGNIYFDTIVSDPFGEFSTHSQSGNGGVYTQFTNTTPGIYMITAAVRFDAGLVKCGSIVSLDGVGKTGFVKTAPLSPPNGTDPSPVQDISGSRVVLQRKNDPSLFCGIEVGIPTDFGPPDFGLSTVPGANYTYIQITRLD